MVKHSISIAGHKTSVSLEDAFWKELTEIAAERHVKVSELAHTISTERENSNLSSAIRLFVLEFYRKQISAHQEKKTGNRAA
jgi:predicted DNA-binding ribbon-helix-helix protein